jgi:hypothetical protein
MKKELLFLSIKVKKIDQCSLELIVENFGNVLNQEIRKQQGTINKYIDYLQI